MKTYAYIGDWKMTKASFTRLQRDLKAAERLFDSMFQLLPDEDCGIAYRGYCAVQDLTEWLQKNTLIKK